MTFDYASIAETSVAQINDKGRTISLLYKTEGSYDVDTDTVYGDSIETIEVKALITNFSKRDVAASLVEQGDLQVLIAANVTKPKTNDIVIDDNEEYAIVSVTEIKPGGTPILYKLQVRK